MCKSKEIVNEKANEKNGAQLVRCLPTVAQGRPLLLGQEYYFGLRAVVDNVSIVLLSRLLLQEYM